MLSLDQIRLLAIGPHVDDIELGCGGMLLRLIHERSAQVHLIVLAGTNEVRKAEAARAAELLGASSVQVFDYKDTELPNCWRDIQDLTEQTIRDTSPAVLFYPHPSERHQDHRTVAGIVETMPSGSLKALLGYQVLGAPVTSRPCDLYVDLDGPAPTQLLERLGLPESAPYRDAKLQLLSLSMESQKRTRHLDPGVIEGKLLVNAYESRFDGLCHAEVFSVRANWMREPA